MKQNVDTAVVQGFGDEWKRFDQSALTGRAFEDMFESYFHIFPWDQLPGDAEGFDLGCGSGRWARGVAPRVAKLHCIDASKDALEVARRNLRDLENVSFHLASVDDVPLADGSMAFGYCLGVLHHVPDMEAGLRHAVSKLRRGAPFLLYIYYAFDNRPKWYAALWRTTNSVRYVLSRLPFPLRYVSSQVIAAVIYLPLARAAALLERAGVNVESLPLSAYRHQKFYSMRTDALDRFGTRLEKRFTRSHIQAAMERAGLRDLRFSETPPYWCAVGTRA